MEGQGLHHVRDANAMRDFGLYIHYSQGIITGVWMTTLPLSVSFSMVYQLYDRRKDLYFAAVLLFLFLPQNT